jgi:hypothetical protein
MEEQGSGEPPAPCPLRARSSSSSRYLTDTHGLFLMALDLRTAGHEDHDYPVPKLTVRVRFPSSAPLAQFGRPYPPSIAVQPEPCH